MVRSPGVAVDIHVVLPNAEQLPILTSREPNYELTELEEVSLRLTDVAGADGAPAELSSVGAYVSRHGPLLLDGEPIALAAIAARGREHRALAEPEVLELVRAAHAPDQTLEDFIVRAARAEAASRRFHLCRSQTLAKRRREKRAIRP